MSIDKEKFKKKYYEAQNRIRNNFKELGPARKRVLICGGGYPGIWLEHNSAYLSECGQIFFGKSPLKDYTPTLLILLEYGKRHPELLS